MRGRFAPSPTGALHLGNLRTALVAWLSARSQAGEFIVRMEDLDPVTSSRGHEQHQLADLAALGLTHDGEVVRQSDRFALHLDAVHTLQNRGLVYPCFCTRREIREAASAPHGDPLPEGAYPGTCRDLSAAEQQHLRDQGRRAALRLRADGRRSTIDDLIAGPTEGIVDDVVLVRNDGVPAYNLAVVVDDHLQGVTEVVRGDDLLSSTARQVYLQQLLGFATPTYAHVPLVVGTDGVRLAKRHGATTLAELAGHGLDAGRVLSMLAASLDLCRPDEPVDAATLVERFSFDALSRRPWTWTGLPR
jgi:glutamyl-tRNA synthetase